MSLEELTEDAVLHVGEVCEVNGRKVVIKVDRNKNLTDIFFNGDIIKNISVNSFIEIRKGFLTIIGKVDGERVEERPWAYGAKSTPIDDRNDRYLTVSLSGYMTRTGKFTGGTKELPLIGNEAYIVSKKRIHEIHNLVDSNQMAVSIGIAESGDVTISLPVDNLFNSHIAIFGNTGSGKSNTLARLYQELYKVLDSRNSSEFRTNSKFILFDFNGEYISENCITPHKKVFNLNTGKKIEDRLPLSEASLWDTEILSVLCSATDKTQKPFIRRAVELYKKVYSKKYPDKYFKGILKNEVTRILGMSDKVKAYQALDYLREVLPPMIEDGLEVDFISDLEWHHNDSRGFKVRGSSTWLSSSPESIENTKLYQHVDAFEFATDDIISKIIQFLYVQLIGDLLSNRAQNDHVAPAISKLKSKQKDIAKVFNTAEDGDIWESNFLVVNLNHVNLDMKKMIPLLLSKKLYSDHKVYKNKKSLTIIVDEAHNILSSESFRESEDWKDYRLETFEEIIKEGRKFGVFVTISSQRPNDISQTITSQAHNYFIHRLVNQKDLLTISNAVSYIDRVTEESIPTLPTGTCVLSGVASPMPLKIAVTELLEHCKPSSHTLKFSNIVPAPGQSKARRITKAGSAVVS